MWRITSLLITSVSLQVSDWIWFPVKSVSTGGFIGHKVSVPSRYFITVY